MEKGLLDGVRWVLFDAVGTLIYPEPPVGDVYFAAARDFGSSLSIAEIQARFCTALGTEQGADSTKLDRRPTSEAHERERWRRIVAAVIHDVPDCGELFVQLWEHFAQAESWRVFRDVSPSLESLGTLSVRFGIASNFDARLHRVVAGIPELQRIEQIFVSSEIGHSKPDPRFFAAVERRLGVAPAEIMLVGDDKVNDFTGAAAAGWKSVFLDRSGRSNVQDAIGLLTDFV